MASNKTIFLHAGFPKTATTFLQKRVFPKLVQIQYAGRHYPKGQRSPTERLLLNSFPITRRITPTEQEQKRINGGHALQAIIDQSSRDVLFSTEGVTSQCLEPISNRRIRSEPFPAPTPRQALEHARDICRAAGFDELKLILTLRRQDELLTSFFAEAFGGRLGRIYSTDKFDKYAEEVMNSPSRLIDNAILDYDILSSICHDIFDKENVLLIDYSWFRTKPTLMCRNLSNFLGVDYDVLERLLSNGQRENVRRSESKDTVLKVRRRNAVNILDEIKSMISPSRNLGIGKILRPILEKLEMGEKEFTPPTSVIDQIRNHYLQSNRAFISKNPDFDSLEFPADNC